MEAVIDRNLARVYRVALARTGHRQDAEDVTQEVFLTFLRNPPVFRDDEHEKAWFIRAALHRSVNVVTGNWRSKVVVGRDDLPDQPAADAPLHDALLSLPHDERTLIYLHYYERMDLAQLAQLLGISAGAAKKRLSRARGKLKTVLGDHDDE